jgi:hypothetical protein
MRENRSAKTERDMPATSANCATVQLRAEQFCRWTVAAAEAALGDS